MAFNIGHFHRRAPHFIVQLGCKACQQVQHVHSLHMTHFARNHQFHGQEARHRLSLQVRMMSRYLLRQKRKNLALSLQTGLRKKQTNFSKRGPPNSVSCEELHKERKLKSGTRFIRYIKKGVQKARERCSRVRNGNRT